METSAESVTSGLDRPVNTTELPLRVGAARASVSLHGEGTTCLVLAHGAGSDRRQPFVLRLAAALADSGRRALLLNFPYREAGRRLPDPAPLLEATIAAAAQLARHELGAERLVLGGRSMGGRIASQAVAAGLPAEGLLLLAYPLHPPGRPERLRDRHLDRVGVPMLFVQGTHDAFARWELLTGVVARLGERATLNVVDDGDHSFAVPKRSGRTPQEVEQAIQAGVREWLEGLGL